MSRRSYVKSARKDMRIAEQEWRRNVKQKPKRQERASIGGTILVSIAHFIVGLHDKRLLIPAVLAIALASYFFR